MKNYTKFYYNFDRKYKLVLALFNNYYLSNYSPNGKVNCKILMVGADESVLLRENEYLFNLIKKLNVQDIARLRKFIPKRHRLLDNKFNRLEEDGITYKDIVTGIKKRYIEKNSVYYKHDYYERVELPNHITIAFIKTGRLTELFQKELFTDLVLLDNYSKHEIQDYNDNRFVGGLVRLNEAICKVKSINKDIYCIKDNDDYLLNVYLTDSDIDTVTVLENEIDNF